jgi:hypothetical protein
LVVRWCHWRLPWRHFFNRIASAISKWRSFKLLRWMQRIPLTSEPIGGFGWNLVWRWWHWRWPRVLTTQCCSFNHSKMAVVQTSEVGATFEPIGGFGWHFVWRWWHWILLTASVCKESSYNGSSQNLLFLFVMEPQEHSGGCAV